MSEPKHEDTKDSEEQITIKVTGPNQVETVFRIKKSTKMSKVIRAYYNQHNIQEGSLRFRFEGVPIDADKTAAEIGLENDDAIDCFVMQTGGF